jgi:methionyl-tRNA formyltransferase
MAATLLLAGDDKVGRSLLARVRAGSVDVCLDRSSSVRRTLRLLRRGVVPASVLAQMALAELLRPDTRLPGATSIRSNAELLQLITQRDVRRVYLFRAGLIIDREVLASGAELLNVHCASLQGYGGLGSIARALADGAWRQEATLHRVTERIDSGEVLDTEPYDLDPARSYRENERRAYEAGARLVLRQLERERLATPVAS